MRPARFPATTLVRSLVWLDARSGCYQRATVGRWYDTGSGNASVPGRAWTALSAK